MSPDARKILGGNEIGAGEPSPYSNTTPAMENRNLRSDGPRRGSGRGGTPPAYSMVRYYAKLNPWFFKGSERMRLPVAAKIALVSAGAMVWNTGSPSPDGDSVLRT